MLGLASCWWCLSIGIHNYHAVSARSPHILLKGYNQLGIYMPSVEDVSKGVMATAVLNDKTHVSVCQKVLPEPGHESLMWLWQGATRLCEKTAVRTVSSSSWHVNRSRIEFIHLYPSTGILESQLEAQTTTRWSWSLMIHQWSTALAISSWQTCSLDPKVAGNLHQILFYRSTGRRLQPNRADDGSPKTAEEEMPLENLFI